jgi:Plasmid replication protein.
MATKKASNDRTRNWTFVIYPTDGNPPAPSNWRDILDEEHIPWIESPLHDKDIDPDGKDKKHHIHILLMFEGKKSFEQIKELTDALNAPIPQKVASAKGLVRYMVHMDNPEKHQYDKSLIIGHGGADAAEYLKPTISSRYELIKEMRGWVKENDVTEFLFLFDYAAEERFEDWFPLLCDNSAYIMGEYIKSRRNYNKL